MEEFSGLLDFVRISSGTSFRSCEPEIIELMRQIDSMIEEKAVQWHKQIKILDNELQLKITENIQLSQDLENSRKEVEILQKQLANEKKHNHTIMMQYDNEVEKFKDELNKFKCKYRKRPKNPKDDNHGMEPVKESSSLVNRNDTAAQIANENVNLLEKSVCNLSMCLHETNRCLDKRVNELHICRTKLESIYFENTILRSFLHQKGIINFLENEPVSNFTEREKEREHLLQEKIRCRIDEFLRTISTP